MPINPSRRIRYAVNRDNQLVLSSGTRSAVARGRFALDAENRLVYTVDESQAWRRQWSVPGELTFAGTWKLDKNHDLTLRVHKGRASAGEGLLTLGGRIIAANGNSMVFEVRSHDQAGLLHLSLLTLTGTWAADSVKRLLFVVEKKQPDTLCFEASWFLDKEQHLTYEYERQELKRKRRTTQTITFLGHWKMPSANRIAYQLTGSSNSVFQFRAHLQTPNLYPQRGVMKYRIGGGFGKRTPRAPAALLLYGAWKFSRSWGARFEVDYGKDGRSVLCMAVEKFITKTGAIEFELKNDEGTSLGVSATVSPHSLKKWDVSLWGRVRHSRRESRIEAGGRMAF